MHVAPLRGLDVGGEGVREAADQGCEAMPESINPTNLGGFVNTSISLSIQENRTVTEYPASLAEAKAMIESLIPLCSDDCSPLDHVSGDGYSGPESVGHYDIWGEDEDGNEWRVHIVSPDVG